MKEIKGNPLSDSENFTDFASKVLVLGGPKELVEPPQHGEYRTRPCVPNKHVSGVVGTI